MSKIEKEEKKKKNNINNNNNNNVNKNIESKKRKLEREIENDRKQIENDRKQIENIKKEIENERNEIKKFKKQIEETRNKIREREKRDERNKIRERDERNKIREREKRNKIIKEEETEEEEREEEKREEKRDERNKITEIEEINSFYIKFGKHYLIPNKDKDDKENNKIIRRVNEIMQSEELNKKDYFEEIKQYAINVKIQNLQAIYYLIVMIKLNYGTLTNKEIEQLYDSLTKLIIENEKEIIRQQKQLQYKTLEMLKNGSTTIDFKQKFNFAKLNQDNKLTIYIVEKLIRLPLVIWKPKYHKHWINRSKELRQKHPSYKLEQIEKFEKIKISKANEEIFNEKVILLLLISKHRKDINSKNLSAKLMMIKGVTLLIIEKLAKTFLRKSAAATADTSTKRQLSNCCYCCRVPEIPSANLTIDSIQFPPPLPPSIKYHDTKSKPLLNFYLSSSSFMLRVPVNGGCGNPVNPDIISSFNFTIDFETTETVEFDAFLNITSSPTASNTLCELSQIESTGSCPAAEFISCVGSRCTIQEGIGMMNCRYTAFYYTEFEYQVDQDYSFDAKIMNSKELKDKTKTETLAKEP